jgi:hypothetical protein
MSEGLFSATVTDNLTELNATLNDYAKTQSKLTTGEVLEKKGRDLTIKIWEGFWAIRQKVSADLRDPEALVFRGPMFTAARRRGWATKVRDNVLSGPYADLYATGQASKILRGGKAFKTDGRPLNKRALLVAQELAMRQRGVGLLGVSFLQFRWRHRAPAKGGSYLVKNVSRKLGTLSQVEQTVTETGGSFHLINLTPGVMTVDNQLGIIAGAMRAARADMLAYLVRKQADALNRQLNKL